MKKVGQWLSYLAAVAMVAAALWLLKTGVDAFLAASATARIGVITAAISVATFVYNNARQQTREIKARQFSDKREAYQKFFDFLFEIFAAQKNGVNLEDDQLVIRMQGITKDLMVWGSAETINQYNAFMRNSLEIDGSDLLATFRNVESLLRAFRKDLGHNDRNLENLGLSKLILKAEEHDRLG